MPGVTIKETDYRGKVLLQMHDGRIVAYYKGKILIYADHRSQRAIQLPLSVIKKCLCRWRLTERMLHMDVRWAVEADGGHILILFENSIFSVELLNGKMQKEQCSFRGKPFSVCQYKGKLFFGDYGLNPDHLPVNIYCRDSDGSWKTKYTFSAGAVRHIHNIIPSGDRIYILTGDEDSESGIWYTDDEFLTVKPYLRGNQQYRCCQMLPTSDGLFYVTDAPSEPNRLYFAAERDVKQIDEIDGTCIYGAKDNDYLVFSTTVEADAHARNILEYWLTNKPGKGIKNTNCSVYVLHDGLLKKIAEFRHDRLPLRLFQYATCYFSNIINGTVYFSPVSVKEKDMRIFECRLM